MQNTKQIRVHPEAHKHLRQLAFDRGVTISDVATQAIAMQFNLPNLLKRLALVDLVNTLQDNETDISKKLQKSSE